MASDTKIGKMALANLGDRFAIEDLTEESTEAELVNLYYDECRLALLRLHPWKFAKKYATPAALAGDAPMLWQQMYQYPSDCVMMRRIVDPTDPYGDRNPPIPFECGLNSNDVYCIFTNQGDAEVEYTANITTTSRFDQLFTVTLSWLISMHICMGATGAKDLLPMAERGYAYWLGQAVMLDSNEGVEREQARDPDWIRNRGSSVGINNYFRTS